jgi:hypothetical protein
VTHAIPTPRLWGAALVKMIATSTSSFALCLLGDCLD